MPGGSGCPPTGAPATAIARDRRSAAGPVGGSLAAVGPVSGYRPRDRSPSRFGSECQPPGARFGIDVRHDRRKWPIHQLAARQPDLPTNMPAEWRSGGVWGSLVSSRLASPGEVETWPPDELLRPRQSLMLDEAGEESTHPDDDRGVVRCQERLDVTLRTATAVSALTRPASDCILPAVLTTQRPPSCYVTAAHRISPDAR